MTLGGQQLFARRVAGTAVAWEVDNHYDGEIAVFADAVRNRRPPAVDGDEGLRNVEILTAAAPR